MEADGYLVRFGYLGSLWMSCSIQRIVLQPYDTLHSTRQVLSALYCHKTLRSCTPYHFDDVLLIIQAFFFFTDRQISRLKGLLSSIDRFILFIAGGGGQFPVGSPSTNRSSRFMVCCVSTMDL